MSSFTAPLEVRITEREVPGGRSRRWLGWLIARPCYAELLTAFVYEVGFVGSGDEIVVPAGFETDFESVPWFARWMIPGLTLAAKAAVIHDYLVKHSDLSWKDSANIFLEAMTVLKVPWLRRRAMWIAVLAYGKVRR